jgi:hypothetical protein
MNFADLLRQLTGRSDIGHVGAAGTPELGITEAISDAFGGSRNDQGGSTAVPGANTTGQVLGAVAPAPTAALRAITPYITSAPPSSGGGGGQTPPPSSELDELKAIEAAGNLNPAQKTRLAELTAPTGGGAPSGFNEMIALARSIADEGRRRAGEQFNRARGIYDEGVGLLGKRKEEFQKLFDEGRETILDRYEGERGNLQASDQGARTRMSNALRAMGLGGSAFIKSEGRQTQNAAKALGGLQTQRNENENANKGEFDTRQEWANTQQSALSRYLQDAESNRVAAENQTDLAERGDVNQINNNIASYLQNIYNTQAALAAAGQGISEFKANPYAVNMDSMVGALNGGVPQVGQMGAGGVQNVNIKDQDPTLALLKRRGGVAGAGLYA